ncbi:MAG: hypothetical protein ACREBE_06925 [bacterium]
MSRLGSLQIERIRRNQRGGDLSAAHLIHLLEEKVAIGAQRASRELIRRMMAFEHYNRRAHTTGSEDGTMHYTVYVKGKGHHLRLDSRGVVFQITDEFRRDLGSVPPWVAPGSEQKTETEKTEKTEKPVPTKK